MLIVETFNSLTDTTGNRYFALCVENRDTGRSAIGTISGGESNISCALRELFGDWEAVRANCHTYQTAPVSVALPTTADSYSLNV